MSLRYLCIGVVLVHFRFKGCLVVFSFYLTVNRTFWIQIVETLIINRVLQRLTWFCIVRICPTKRTQGLYEFKTTVSEAYIIVNGILSLSLTVLCMKYETLRASLEYWF